MASGMELATAWVKLVPSVDGISEQMTKAFAPGADAAAKEGDKAGKGWSSKVKGAIGTAAIVGGVVAAFKGLYSVGEIFDDVSDTIRTGTGAQGKALDGLVESAKNVGLQVPAEFEAIGTTIADVNTRFGLSGEVLETVASQYLEAGRIPGEEVDIGKTSAAFSAFKIEGDGVVDAMDSLFQISQATGVGMNELADGVQANAPAVQSLGFSFEETASLVGTLDKAGLNSSKMLGGMSRAMVELAKDGEAPADAFKRVTGELDVLIKNGDEAAAIDLAAGIFGTKNASQFIGAIEGGVFALDDLMGATGATSDTIMGVGQETADFAETLQVTMNTFMVAIEPLATAVFSAVGDGLAAVLPYLQDMGAWLSENPAAIKIAAVVLGVLAAGFLALSVATWIANTALLANPITWIVVGIVALIAAIVALVMNWDTVVAFIKNIWGKFIDWIVGVIDGFVSFWTGVWNKVSTFFSDIWKNLLAGVKAIWKNIKDFFKSALDWIVDIFLNWTVYGLIIKNWDAIKQFFVDVWDNIKNAVKAAIDWVADKIDTVINGIKSVWQTVWGAIKTFFSDIWNNIVSAAGSFFTSVKNKFDAVITFVKGIPAKVKGFFTGLGTLLLDSGKALIQGFIDGITEAFEWAKDKVSEGLGFIRDLFPFSPAKEGPFSGSGWVANSGKSVGEAFTGSLMDSLKDGKSKVASGLDGIHDLFAADVNGLGVSASVAGSVSFGEQTSVVSANHSFVSSDGLLARVEDSDESLMRAGSNRVRLVVRDREFDAFLEDVAEGAADRKLSPLSGAGLNMMLGVTNGF